MTSYSSDMRRALASLLLTACSSGSVGPIGAPADEDDPSASVYDPSELLEVEVELPPDDWQILREQDRNIFEVLAGECLSQPFDSDYTWFEADVVIDGEAVDGVGVRKKGLVGSVVSDRPSLKVDFDRFVDDQRFRGLEHLTLNNQRQDASRIVACLAYGRFTAAGLPAPRCGLAHVVVNGEDLGVYANVEPMKRTFLERAFGTGDGALYEGTLSDFRDGWTDTFESDTDGADADGGASLRAVVDALDEGARDPDVLLDSLDTAIDLDQYLSFWAMEVLLGHWDGYDANTNNFYVYAPEPGDGDGGRLRFLPWGIDAAFAGDFPFGEGRPTSVVAAAALPAALYPHPDGQARYFDALQRHLDGAWDEDALLAQVEALGGLALERADNDEMEPAIDAIAEWIEGRRGGIEDELAGGAPTWDEELREEPCLEEIGSIDLTFSTTWNSFGVEDPFSNGDGTWDVVLYDQGLPVGFLGAVAGVSEDTGLILVFGQLSTGANLAVYALLDPDLVTSGANLTVDWNDVTAYLLFDEDGDYADFAIAAYLGDGSLVLERGGTGYGDVLEGRLEVGIWGG